MGSPIARGVPIATPISCPSRSRPGSCASSRTSRAGARRRSGRSWRVSIRMCTRRRSARSMRFFDRHGLVKRRMGRRNRTKGTALSLPGQPNDLWCADYKGEFMLADRRYCYPLTITDFASRYLFACEALSTTKETYAFTVFEAVFREFGLPKAIRTDNGVPFASPHPLFGLSKLSVWWLRLGIHIERIKPGHPQQNGRHERMHLTLKKEATKPAAL